eukprot:TRINITY_DN21863_c0_g1_i1.p1 TRINITY_DN21863_c0_g1~~TRINITY_DN21863_c0_g1_i1.p1  ORF type:complete len:427 (-),score=97.29 TRINITY_DN21863_c0_g1_i1:57-1307(-)
MFASASRIQNLSRSSRSDASHVMRIRSIGNQSGRRSLTTTPVQAKTEESTTDSVGSGNKAPTAIVLLNLGGPQTEGDVKPFLTRLFNDPEIIPLPFQSIASQVIVAMRHKSVAQTYKEIGGSPLRKWTEIQGKELIDRLDKLCPETAPHKFYLSFRYSHPLTDECLQEMKKDGVTRAVAFTQYPQFSCTTTGSSLNELWRSQQRLGIDNIQWSLIDRWPLHDGFISAVADNINKGLEKFPEDVRDDVVVVFSAHSLPIRTVQRGDTYPTEVAATVHRLMEKHLKYSHKYMLCWQSAVGPQEWLGPQTIKTIEDLGKRGQNALVVPIAFTSDHIETLAEIDREIAEVAHKAGMKHFHRAASLNDSPIFADALADIASKHLHGDTNHSRQYSLKCPKCVNPWCRTIKNPAFPEPAKRH